MENSCELTRSIWNELFFLQISLFNLRKHLYYISKSTKTCIYMFSFLQSLSFRSCPPYSFRTCQINQYQPCLNLFNLYFITYWIMNIFIQNSLYHSSLINIYVQDSMTSTWSVVHLLTCHFSELHSCIYYLNCLFYGLDRHFCKFFNKYFSICFLSNL